MLFLLSIFSPCTFQTCRVFGSCLEMLFNLASFGLIVFNMHFENKDKMLSLTIK